MNKKNLKDFLLYIIVGGIATLAEWIIFYLLDKLSFHYAFATVTAYIISTFVNWLAGRILVFKKSQKPLALELGGIYLGSIIGLALNLLIMWVAVDIMNIHGMLAKIIATAIVFVYNFLIRKLIIYK